MANNADPKADDNYQSTPADKKLARLLGITYLLIAIFLGWGLFKIWPPTPWPTDKGLEQNPQLAKALGDCECPTPTPTPKPSPSVTPTPAANAATGSAPDAGRSPNTSTTPTASARTTSSAPTPNTSSPSTKASSNDVSQTSAATPTPTPSATPIVNENLVPIPINFFWGLWCWRTSFDERLILLVIIAGMLGSFVHGATSLGDFIGNNKFNRNWAWFYLLRPTIGMALALVFYFVVRGGFLTTSGGAKDINPYGIAALAGLVGMFSKQATDKLSEVFSTLFRAAQGEGDDKRQGSLNAEPPKPEGGAGNDDGAGNGNRTGGDGDGQQPVTGESSGDQDAIDGCDVQLDTNTSDEDLPITEGGVK